MFCYLIVHDYQVKVNECVIIYSLINLELKKIFAQLKVDNFYPLFPVEQTIKMLSQEISALALQNNSI